MTRLRFTLLGIALYVLLTLALVSCVDITVLYPVCEQTTIDVERHTVSVDTIPPDSVCIAEFVEATS
jgi:hypothetical protein